jgi:hypothetical protein
MNDEVWPPHLDAVIAAPDNHRVLMDDETIRVLEVTVEPGEREPLHHHRWPSLMVVLARPSYVNRDATRDDHPSGWRNAGRRFRIATSHPAATAGDTCHRS